MKKINLSLKKLIELLHKKFYVLESVYCENNLIKFIECRTPKYQKSFFIFIPDKYSMKYVYISTVKKQNIKVADDLPSSYHLEYVSDMKGEILDCDLAVVTGMDIFLYFDNSEYKYYHFIKDETVKKEKNKINTLVSKTNTIKKELFKEEESIDGDSSNESLDGDSSDESPDILEKDESLEEEEKEPLEGDFSKESPESSRESSLDDSLEEEEEEEEEKEESFKDNLEKKENAPIENKNLEDEKEDEEFLSDKDMVDEDEEPLLNKDIPKEKPKRVKLLFEKDESEDDMKLLIDEKKPKSSFKKLENVSLSGISSFNNLKELEINLGIVFISINIHVFFKKIDSYEEKIVSCYYSIDENEMETRTKKINKMKDICATIIEKVTLRLDQKNKKERKIKNELLKLLSVLSQIEELKTKAKKDPIKYQADIMRLDELYQQTKDTIHEANIELLKVKDSIHELLNNYYMILQNSLK